MFAFASTCALCEWTLTPTDSWNIVCGNSVLQKFHWWGIQSYLLGCHGFIYIVIVLLSHEVNQFHHCLIVKPCSHVTSASTLKFDNLVFPYVQKVGNFGWLGIFVFLILIVINNLLIIIINKKFKWHFLPNHDYQTLLILTKEITGKK